MGTNRSSGVVDRQHYHESEKKVADAEQAPWRSLSPISINFFKAAKQALQELHYITLLAELLLFIYDCMICSFRA